MARHNHQNNRKCFNQRNHRQIFRNGKEEKPDIQQSAKIFGNTIENQEYQSVIRHPLPLP